MLLPLSKQRRSLPRLPDPTADPACVPHRQLSLRLRPLRPAVQDTLLDWGAEVMTASVSVVAVRMKQD